MGQADRFTRSESTDCVIRHKLLRQSGQLSKAAMTSISPPGSRISTLSHENPRSSSDYLAAESVLTPLVEAEHLDTGRCERVETVTDTIIGMPEFIGYRPSSESLENLEVLQQVVSALDQELIVATAINARPTSVDDHDTGDASAAAILASLSAPGLVGTINTASHSADAPRTSTSPHKRTRQDAFAEKQERRKRHRGLAVRILTGDALLASRICRLVRASFNSAITIPASCQTLKITRECLTHFVNVLTDCHLLQVDGNLIMWLGLDKLRDLVKAAKVVIRPDPVSAPSLVSGDEKESLVLIRGNLSKRVVDFLINKTSKAFPISDVVQHVFGTPSCAKGDLDELQFIGSVMYGAGLLHAWDGTVFSWDDSYHEADVDGGTVGTYADETGMSESSGLEDDEITEARPVTIRRSRVGQASKRQNRLTDSSSIAKEEDSETHAHRASCHRCGNMRKMVIRCTVCPQIYCRVCADMMQVDHGPAILQGGCPKCKEVCCCGKNRSTVCDRANHCYRKCPTTKGSRMSSGYAAEILTGYSRHAVLMADNITDHMEGSAEALASGIMKGHITSLSGLTAVAESLMAHEDPSVVKGLSTMEATLTTSSATSVTSVSSESSPALAPVPAPPLLPPRARLSKGRVRKPTAKILAARI